MSGDLDLSEEVLFGMEEHDEREKAGRSVEELDHEDHSGTDRVKKTRAGKDATDVVQTSEIAENGAFAEALLAFRTNG